MASLSDSRPDDSALISGALRGDEEALNDLFSRYYRFLHFLASRVVVHQNPAQESAIVRCSKSSNFREGFWSRGQIEGLPNRTNRMGILEYGYTHSEAGSKGGPLVYAATA
jgi:hypothetical protein